MKNLYNNPITQESYEITPSKIFSKFKELVESDSAPNIETALALSVILGQLTRIQKSRKIKENEKCADMFEIIKKYADDGKDAIIKGACSETLNYFRNLEEKEIQDTEKVASPPQQKNEGPLNLLNRPFQLDIERKAALSRQESKRNVNLSSIPSLTNIEKKASPPQPENKKTSASPRITPPVSDKDRDAQIFIKNHIIQHAMDPQYDTAGINYLYFFGSGKVPTTLDNIRKVITNKKNKAYQKLIDILNLLQNRGESKTRQQKTEELYVSLEKKILTYLEAKPESKALLKSSPKLDN